MSSFTGSSFTHRVDPDARLALGCMWGTVSGAEMLDLVEAVHDDPAWQPTFDVIWDCSRVTAHIVLPADVKPIIDEAARDPAGRGILIESPSVGGSLIAELLAIRSRLRGRQVTACKTMAEALETLGHDALPAALALLADQAEVERG